MQLSGICQTWSVRRNGRPALVWHLWCLSTDTAVRCTGLPLPFSPSLSPSHHPLVPASTEY